MTKPSWRVEARTVRFTDNTYATVTVTASDDEAAATEARRWLREVYGHDNWAIDAVNRLTLPVRSSIDLHPLVRP